MTSRTLAAKTIRICMTSHISNQTDPMALLPIFADAASAVTYASTFLAADPTRWTNLGIAESEYLDYLRAGRPSHWPVAI